MYFSLNITGLGHSVILWVTLVFPMQWEVTQRPTKIKQVWVVSEMYGGQVRGTDSCSLLLSHYHRNAFRN